MGGTTYQTMMQLRVLGGINLALTIFRVCTFQFGHGTHSSIRVLDQCSTIAGGHPILRILCTLYNTKRSYKILWTIRSFFTLILFIKRVRNSRSCYGFWFISTIAELCIKIYLCSQSAIDPPGIVQFLIELLIVYLLTSLVTEKSASSTSVFSPGQSCRSRRRNGKRNPSMEKAKDVIQIQEV